MEQQGLNLPSCLQQQQKQEKTETIFFRLWLSDRAEHWCPGEGKQTRGSHGRLPFVCSFVLRPYLLHMEVPRLGAASELQLLAYTTAAAMLNPSLSATYTTAHGNTVSLTHPLSEARDRTRVLKDTSQVCYH